MQCSHSVTTRATPGRIWAIWTDVEGWPLWDTELSKARLDGLFALDTRGMLQPLRGPAAAFRITALTPSTGYTFTTTLALCRLSVERTLTDAGGSTRFTHTVTFDGPLAFVWSLVLGRRYRRALPRVMERIRRLAEEPA